MDDLVFCLTEYTMDINGKKYTVKAGDVWRASTMCYSDATVLGIAQSKYGTWVRIARPYCYASSVGTTGPVPLTGVEIYTVSFERFVTSDMLLASDFVTT